MTTTTRPLTISRDWDADTLQAAISEIESYFDYEGQSDRLDDRTEEAFTIALEVMRNVEKAHRVAEAA